MHASHVLTIESLSRRFSGRVVVDSLDLKVGPGERVALRGPNGSGKTTVLRCVAGTLEPTSGTIRVGSYPAGTLEARHLVGSSLSQERSFYLRLSGHDNLLFFARLRCASERDARRNVDLLEEELQVEEIVAKRADRCSTGMIQQLAFARALLGEPRLLLLDEPTRSLDVEARERFWRALDSRPQAAVLLATHLDEDTIRCGSRIDLGS